MNTFTLYIGADNKTKRVNESLVKSIVSKNHDGFTYAKAVGYWQSRPEATAVVTIADEPAKVRATIKQLKSALSQDAIGYTVSPAMRFE